MVRSESQNVLNQANVKRGAVAAEVEGLEAGVGVKKNVGREKSREGTKRAQQQKNRFQTKIQVGMTERE